MNQRTSFSRNAINKGLLAGLIATFISAIGMVALFHKREMIAGVLTMGQLFLFMPVAILSYLAAHQVPSKKGSYQAGALTGIFAALPVMLLSLLGYYFHLRDFMPNVSEGLIRDILNFGQPFVIGALILLVVNVLLGLAAALTASLPQKTQEAIISALLWTVIIATFSEIINDRIRAFFGVSVASLFFTSKALQPVMAVVLFAAIFAANYFRQQRPEGLKPMFQSSRYSWAKNVLVMAFLLVLPWLLGTYLSEVATNIGLYIIMGLGLNIVVGFAGLLDLGYVAFFAIGAYIMGIMTSTGPLGIGHTNFWVALPISVLAATTAGVILGTPVLRLRGDYLAIVTLGFGEIIRVLANSDLLKPYMGGAQGILNIPRPELFGIVLKRPEQVYYIVLAGIGLAWFLSVRLQNSRLGRQWMAMREDEDVAEAMGINLINTKLLAFGIGAGLSGLAGAIFAAKLTSIFPHSFNLIISINILSLIIIGGMGSLPGVVVGAIVLVGLPELLREFAEFRMLMYGVLLMVMMLVRPEGLIPSTVIKRELAADDENFEEMSEVIA